MVLGWVVAAAAAGGVGEAVAAAAAAAAIAGTPGVASAVAAATSNAAAAVVVVAAAAAAVGDFGVASGDCCTEPVTRGTDAVTSQEGRTSDRTRVSDAWPAEGSCSGC